MPASEGSLTPCVPIPQPQDGTVSDRHQNAGRTYMHPASSAAGGRTHQRSPLLAGWRPLARHERRARVRLLATLAARLVHDGVDELVIESRGHRDIEDDHTLLDCRRDGAIRADRSGVTIALMTTGSGGCPMRWPGSSAVTSRGGATMATSSSWRPPPSTR